MKRKKSKNPPKKIKAKAKLKASKIKVTKTKSKPISKVKVKGKNLKQKKIKQKKTKTHRRTKSKANLKVKENILNTLQAAKEQFKKRINYNKEINLKSKDPIRQAFLDFYKQDTMKTDKRLKSRVERLIKIAKENSYGRISKKAMARFIDTWKIEGSVDKYGFIVFNEESAFRNMLLEVLRTNGVDVTNPSELNKAMQGMDATTIYKVWKDQKKSDKDTFYEDFTKNSPLQFIRNIKKEVRESAKYRKWQETKAKSLLEMISQYE